MSTITLLCPQCNQKFDKLLKDYKQNLKRNRKSFCSQKCIFAYRSTKLKTSCTFCKKELQRTPSQIAKTTNSFCNASCNMKFMNINRTGFRRSKLELFFEEKIKEKFSNLNFNSNERKLLDGIELDFYFPTLNLAIEINGIVHYEPIYGIDKLTSIKKNDRRKMLECERLGVELIVVPNINACKQKAWDETEAIIKNRTG